MTYDEIQLSIAELRAELHGAILTRAEQQSHRAQLAALERQAAEQQAAFDDSFLDDR